MDYLCASQTHTDRITEADRYNHATTVGMSKNIVLFNDSSICGRIGRCSFSACNCCGKFRHTLHWQLARINVDGVAQW